MSPVISALSAIGALCILAVLVALFWPVFADIRDGISLRWRRAKRQKLVKKAKSTGDAIILVYYDKSTHHKPPEFHLRLKKYDTGGPYYITEDIYGVKHITHQSNILSTFTPEDFGV